MSENPQINHLPKSSTQPLPTTSENEIIKPHDGYVGEDIQNLTSPSWEKQSDEAEIADALKKGPDDMINQGSRKILATKSNGEIVPIEMRIVSKITAGGDSVVYRASAKKDIDAPYADKVDFPEEETTLIAKRLRIPQDRLEIQRNFNDVNRIGLPVPNVFMMTEEDILMTDLSNNGENVVISSNELNPKVWKKLVSQRPGFFDTFKTLNTDEISSKLQAYAAIATSNGVALSGDWYFLSVDPSGNYQLSFADFGRKPRITEQGFLKVHNDMTSSVFALTLKERQEGTLPRAPEEKTNEIFPPA